MEVKSELIDAQFEMLADEVALAAKTAVVSKVVFVLSNETAYIGTTAGWVRLGGGGSLGDVKQSSLDPTDFATENGNTWVLADGRDVTGSDWHSLTATAFIPDYRGVSLVSKNEGRADGFADPDGEKVVGTTYQDKTASNGLTNASDGSHTHETLVENTASGGSTYSSLEFAAYGGGTFQQPPTVRPTTVVAAGSHAHSISGDNDTIPRHGIVYTYIKINR